MQDEPEAARMLNSTGSGKCMACDAPAGVHCEPCTRAREPLVVAAPSPVAETVDTSAEAVERLLAAIGPWPEDGTFYRRSAEFATCVGATIRALAAERDDAVARASDHGAYRSAAAGFMASKQLLPEFDAWCEARGMPADAVGRLVEVARAARGMNAITENCIRFYEGTGPEDCNPETKGLDSCIIGWRYPGDPMTAWDVLPPAARLLKATLDALPPGILDQEPSEGR